MKVWLNDLKEGDEFYYIILDEVFKCKHLGNAYNPNFRMSRIKFKILDNSNFVKILNEAFGEERELFVNQYVYDDYDSANEVLIEKLKKELETTESSIIEYKDMIIRLEKREEELRKILSEKCQ